MKATKTIFDGIAGRGMRRLIFGRDFRAIGRLAEAAPALSKRFSVCLLLAVISASATAGPSIRRDQGRNGVDSILDSKIFLLGQDSPRAPVALPLALVEFAEAVEFRSPDGSQLHASTVGAMASFRNLLGAPNLTPVEQRAEVAATTGRDAFSGNLNVSAFGAVGDGVADDGPAIRAAIESCAHGNFREVYLPSPRVGYVVKSLDKSGLGGLVFGDGGKQFACALRGEAVNTTGHWVGGVNIKLGASLNRPLVYVRSGAGSVILRNVRLDGNAGAQQGWAGGPSGKLYTIQVEDGVPYPEGSVDIERSYVVNGFNGNIYIGANRGNTSLVTTKLLYGGQSVNDASLFVQGYDLSAVNLGIGSHKGTAAYFGGCIQCFIVNSAFWANNVGMVVAPGVNQLFGTNVTFQANATNQLRIFGGGRGKGAISFNNASFQSGSYGSRGVYSDVLSINSTRLYLTNPDFYGNDGYNDRNRGAGSTPKYNIEHVGASQVNVIAPRYITGQSSTTDFTNDYTALRGQISIRSGFEPRLVGRTEGGYAEVVGVGDFSIANGMATVTFRITTTAQSGAAGPLLIGGLPFRSSAALNHLGYCYLSQWQGWIGTSGYTALSARIPTASNFAELIENGSGLATRTADASHFAGAMQLQGACVYPTDQ